MTSLYPDFILKISADLVELAKEVIVMAKKKAKKTAAKKKAKKPVVKKKITKKVKKIVRKIKPGKAVASKAKARAVEKEKVLGKVEHYFGKISVAAIRVAAPFKVGDVIHIKGHTTDFVQKIESMQIEHQSVPGVKKGDDIGIKVREHVREHDVVYLGGKESLARLAAGQNVQLPLQPPPPPAKPDPYGGTKFIGF